MSFSSGKRPVWYRDITIIPGILVGTLIAFGVGLLAGPGHAVIWGVVSGGVVTGGLDE